MKIIERGAKSQRRKYKNAGFHALDRCLKYWTILTNLDQNRPINHQMRWNGLSILKSRLTKEQMEYSNCGGVEAFRTQDKRSLGYFVMTDWMKPMHSLSL